MFDRFVSAVLDGDQSELVRDLISHLRPYGMARLDAERTLKSAEAPVRVVGLAFVLMDLGYGSEPDFAANLGHAVLRRWARQIEGLAFRNEDEKLLTLLSIIRSTAQACLLTGDFTRCIQLIDTWLVPARFRRLGQQFASAYLLKAEAFAHQLAIAEALTAFRELSPDELRAAPETPVVWGYIAPYLVETLEPEPVFDYGARIRQIVEGPLAENFKTVELWTASWNDARLPPEHRHWANAKLDALRAEIERLTALSADRALTDAERVDELTRGVYAVGVMAREVQLAGGPVGRLDLHGVDERINYAATVDRLAEPTGREIERALEGAEEATAWCTMTGCKRALLNALQAMRGIYTYANDIRNANEVSLRLFRELRELREQSSVPEVRAAIARVYRRLSFAICRAADELSLPANALSATEFRRGLLVVDPRRHAEWTAPDPLVTPLGPSLLGPNTHYLGLTSFDDDDPIAASLYCADGTVAFHWIPLTPARFRRAAERVNPRDWTERPAIFGTPKIDPRSEFACLLEPLRKAMADGQIVEGDHICTAVDGPAHAVPLHYLPLHGRPAVKLLSFSRVSSLADARLIIESPVTRPQSAWAAFIPADPERNVDMKAAAFDDVCRVLRSADIGVTVADGSSVDGDALITALERHRLVYVQSHGTFRADHDPVDRAGILVSANGRLPFRGVANPSLLTPRRLLSSRASSPGGVVALSACVSGLGRQAVGGDTIGLELALRVHGAATVIASHWDLTWRAAANFFQTFFERWLIAGESRARAWQNAILRHADSTDFNLALLEACAFSLFGDWR